MGTLITSSRYVISIVLFSKFILGIPEAENFAFSFNTLLSDVAVKFPEFRSNILEMIRNAHRSTIIE